MEVDPFEQDVEVSLEVLLFGRYFRVDPPIRADEIDRVDEGDIEDKLRRQEGGDSLSKHEGRVCQAFLWQKIERINFPTLVQLRPTSATRYR